MDPSSELASSSARADAKVGLDGLLEEYAIGRDDHLNAPAFVVRPDDVRAVLSTLRDEACFDHCACVTAQQYPDRYETIYHLRSYDDATREVSVVVPTPIDDPRSESAAPVYGTADWHEREAYDLIGIEYAGHPDLRRILLPETWQGHPLSNDYDQHTPQVVTLTEHANPIAGDKRDPESETMFLNIGPHHPATHGVMHVKAVLDGETVVDAEPDIGYMHRCEEQLCQQGTYRHQIMPYPDRWDWVSSGLLNEWAYARTAEELAGIEVPEYAQVVRTMGAELSRMASHFIAVGTYALDVIGEFTAAFMYAMRDRELVLDILEDLTGQRMMFNYLRLGGVAWDLPEPRGEFVETVRDFLDGLPAKIEEYHDLLTQNEIFQLRVVDTGVLDPEVARQYGCTGPVARGSGIDYDLRRDDPYGYYPNLEWDVVTESAGDNYSRLLVRMGELEESAKIVEQCLDLLEDWPEADREIRANVPRTLKPDPDAELYRAIEGAKGELGIYIRSDGTDTPARFKIRSPSFSNLSALPEISRGGYVADLIASIGSLDCIMGEVDR
ncbi:NADH-quinone oxidoreductase subunit D [Halopiger djelfimassiliensis]|uniref:NADH-quinone oxidoreductase subunit D n=1 Tax=Halopiger djelfimassiliensis TaxID=1293047 RepID=UPI00067773D0|nr:NADH-quinone oxidoreductase subunit D [Halopiger djelfimassiliensis]